MLIIIAHFDPTTQHNIRSSETSYCSIRLCCRFDPTNHLLFQLANGRESVTAVYIPWRGRRSSGSSWRLWWCVQWPRSCPGKSPWHPPKTSTAAPTGPPAATPSASRTPLTGPPPNGGASEAGSSPPPFGPGWTGCVASGRGSEAAARGGNGCCGGGAELENR